MAFSDFHKDWPRKLSEVQDVLDYRFVRHELIFQALTHSSYSNETATSKADAAPLPDNERLEFLGDAVIGLVVANHLMGQHPAACEGKLSRWRSSLVSRRTLAEISAQLKLGESLMLGRGERRTGGAEKQSILAAVLEAVVGAMYLDGGLEVARGFLIRIYEPWISELSLENEGILSADNKTHLQERSQSQFKATPVYRVAEAWGPEHQKNFRVEILIEGKVIATGDGRSKKEAEQRAACAALQVLEF